MEEGNRKITDPTTLRWCKLQQFLEEEFGSATFNFSGDKTNFYFTDGKSLPIRIHCENGQIEEISTIPSIPPNKN